MVQVQSSWFPLYDRNPQTFVPNIFWAKPGDYKKATQKIFHEAARKSCVELPRRDLAVRGLGKNSRALNSPWGQRRVWRLDLSARDVLGSFGVGAVPRRG